MTNEQIRNIFAYHASLGTQTARYETMQDAARALAILINAACPESREKSLALTAVQEAVMWANSAIALNEKGVSDT